MIQPGIYRRAFDWRLSKLDKDSISNTAAAFVTLSSDEYAEIFEDYFTITRKRKANRMAMAKVQLHLVEELLIAQAAAKQYRDNNPFVTRNLQEFSRSLESNVPLPKSSRCRGFSGK